MRQAATGGATDREDNRGWNGRNASAPQYRVPGELALRMRLRFKRVSARRILLLARDLASPPCQPSLNSAGFLLELTRELLQAENQEKCGQLKTCKFLADSRELSAKIKALEI